MISAHASDDLGSNSAVNTRNFLAELKRRNVYKVAVAYAVVAWLLIQAASIFLPTFDAPACVMKAFVVFLALGFILSVIVSWVFDLTPEGIIRTADISPDETPDIVRQLEAQARQQFVRGYLFALIQAGLGDKTKAIDCLERAYLNHGNIDNAYIRVDPMLDLLSGDHRFETLADKTPDITRAAQPRLRLSKQLRRALAAGAPAFPAVKEILSAPSREVARGEQIQTADTEKNGTPPFGLSTEEVNADLVVCEKNGDTHCALRPCKCDAATVSSRRIAQCAMLPAKA
jgi:hypothetical protein